MINPFLDEDDPTRTLLIKLTTLVGAGEADMAATARGEAESYRIYDRDDYHFIQVTADELKVFMAASNQAARS